MSLRGRGSEANEVRRVNLKGGDIYCLVGVWELRDTRKTAKYCHQLRNVDRLDNILLLFNSFFQHPELQSSI